MICPNVIRDRLREAAAPGRPSLAQLEGARRAKGRRQETLLPEQNGLAEAAAAAVAEASALRRQLQATREKVDAMHEEGLVSKEEVGMEARVNFALSVAG